jgi:hypothetical protein
MVGLMGSDNGRHVLGILAAYRGVNGSKKLRRCHDMAICVPLLVKEVLLHRVKRKQHNFGGLIEEVRTGEIPFL